MMQLSTWCVLGLFCLTSFTMAYPTGMPTEACIDMNPKHGVRVQTSDPPFVLEITQGELDSSYAGILYTLRSKTNVAFKGFAIYAEQSGKQMPYLFGATPGIMKPTCQRGLDVYAATHVNATFKRSVRGVWFGPELSHFESLDPIHLKAVVVAEKVKFWKDLQVEVTISEKFRQKIIQRITAAKRIKSRVNKTMCHEGFYSETCTKACSSNCLGGKCNTMTGNCFSCIDGKYGQFCEKHCVGCDRCYRSGTCIQICQLGQYGPRCGKICSPHCLASECHYKTGDCALCKLGYFGPKCSHNCEYSDICDASGDPTFPECAEGTCCEGDDCSLECSRYCATEFCYSTGICRTCSTGYYGLNCDIKCSGCDECYRNGTCLVDKCRPGYWGPYCDEKCSIACLFSNCNYKDGSCRECPTGRHGKSCEKGCVTPHCTVLGVQIKKLCPVGKYGDLCELDCSEFCENKLCTKALGSCLSCPGGRYGYKCEHFCSNCESCSRSGRCLTRCFPGFYGEHCEQSCVNCYQNKCYKNGTCKKCIKDHYGEDCEFVCFRCKSCDINGKCLTKCYPEFSGTNCKVCNYCEQGKCFLNGTCERCTRGKYGYKCEHECSNCDHCDRMGKCLTDCAPGFFGDKCDRECSYCYEKQCFRNGTCQDCTTGSYGAQCELFCPNCRSCTVTGECVSNCRRGYFGEHCQEICINCERDLCYKNGTCRNCITGYFGIDCQQTCINCLECSRAGICPPTKPPPKLQTDFPEGQGRETISPLRSGKYKGRGKTNGGPSSLVRISVALLSTSMLGSILFQI